MVVIRGSLLPEPAPDTGAARYAPARERQPLARGEILDWVQRIDGVPRPPRPRYTQLYADEYAGHPYERVPASLYKCCLCDSTAHGWDHCHPHNYIRGPLCRPCNALESGWHEEGRFPEYFAKCPDCARR